MSEIEPTRQAVRALRRTASRSPTRRTPVLVWEDPYYPAYYLPVADVRTDLLVPTDTVTHSPSRGDARYFTVKVGDVERVDAAWQYTDSPIEELRDLIRFDWAAMDAWFEEDEEVFVHPRSPYTRVDILPIVAARARRARRRRARRVDARARAVRDRACRRAGTSRRTTCAWICSCTPTRTSQCPYKGTGRVLVGAHRRPAWRTTSRGRTRTPLPESERVGGLIAFYNERVDLVSTVDERTTGASER